MSYITQTLTGELVLHAAHEPETKTSDLATKSRNFKSYIYHKSLANHKRLAHFLRHSYTIHDGHNPQPMAAESTDPKLSDANVSSGESDCMSYMYQSDTSNPATKGQHRMSYMYRWPNAFRFSYGESALHVINDNQCRYLIPVTKSGHYMLYMLQ